MAKIDGKQARPYRLVKDLVPYRLFTNVRLYFKYSAYAFAFRHYVPPDNV